MPRHGGSNKTEVGEPHGGYYLSKCPQPDGVPAVQPERPLTDNELEVLKLGEEHDQLEAESRVIGDAITHYTKLSRANGARRLAIAKKLQELGGKIK